MIIFAWIFPAFLLLFVVTNVPKHRLVFQPLSRKLMLAGGLFAVLLTLVLMLWVPNYVREQIYTVIVLYTLPFLIIIQSLFLYSAFHTFQKIEWGHLLVSVTSLALVCYCLYMILRSGGLAFLLAFGVVIASIGVILVAGIWMIWALPGLHKLVSVISLVGVPLALIVSSITGNKHSPELITQKNGSAIIQALEEFYVAQTVYPEQLRELVPVYLETLPEAVTTQGTGWLYVASGDAYTLGYWDWPEKYCTRLYRYSSGNSGWTSERACSVEEWQPFTYVPTPQYASSETPQPTLVIKPDEAEILYPLSGETVSGVVDIKGTVSFVGFESYVVLYSEGESSTTDVHWQPIVSSVEHMVVEGTLATWDTTNLLNGEYVLVLGVFTESGAMPRAHYVKNITVLNP